MARHPSLESERPIMAPSVSAITSAVDGDRVSQTTSYPSVEVMSSKRFSTLSGSPSLALSDRTTASLPSGDPRMADIKEYSDGLERLENKPLQSQRFVPTPEKTDNLNKLALGAKVERALGRRMTGQDAVMRNPIGLNEKKALEGGTPTVS